MWPNFLSRYFQNKSHNKMVVGDIIPVTTSSHVGYMQVFIKLLMYY